MYFFSKHANEYDSVSTSDIDCTFPSSETSEPQRNTRKLQSFLYLGLAIAVLLGIVALSRYQLIGVSEEFPLSRLQTSKICLNPSIRREWRSLSEQEKNNYIDAVRCLATTPSELRSDGTIYDDFPWVHSHVSHITHGAAPFFTWHRYFIHLYEMKLKKLCGYRGALPFWDWTLDWERMAESPIWHNETGFGRDGGRDEPETIGHGRCVVDGPFSNFKPLYSGNKYQPHCLSRGFTKDFSGIQARPEAIEQINLIPSFEKFFLAVENGPHNIVPNGVRGDFYSFTAPYDPVFFLHHAQLDRIWWMWQMRAPGVRMREYGGKGSTHSNETATVNDILPMGGLGADVFVHEVMETESNLLCYRYF